MSLTEQWTRIAEIISASQECPPSGIEMFHCNRYIDT